MFELSTQVHRVIVKLAIVISGTTLFLIPITMLTVVSMVLVHKLRIINQKRKVLFSNCRSLSAGTTTSIASAPVNRMDHTNRTLLLIMFLFLACEVPSMVMYGCNTILGNDFIENVFHNIGILVDFVQLSGSFINFCLLVSMSQLFRQTLARVLSVRSISRTASTSGTKETA